ncbi:MAG: valine--tRNA ligase [Patescibacteria group bacterium]
MNEIPKAYNASNHEDAIYKKWLDKNAFNPDTAIKKGLTSKDAEHFSIVLPPPNVTGTLHLGHAVMLAIEDVMTRYNRMQGKRTLWLPGTDHAAIATQSKVEKILFEEEGKTRHDLGRSKFLEKVEKFAQDSHDTIVHQSMKMGASLDWSREAYTLDEKRNLAVKTVFKKMYDDGLIYRGERIVNWDPKMQTNVSDDELERVEKQTKFYYLQYGPFVIGTARPETKFGDKYVVMHPDDKRYAEYSHGQQVDLEWINGPVTATIVKDKAVDPDFGTGVMTITPWHDTADFEIAQRHELDYEMIIDLEGKLTDIAGEFAGQDIFEARDKIVKKLDDKNLLVKIDEEYVHSIATNSRGGGIIEPQIRRQWFIDVNKEFTLEHSNIEGIASGSKVTLKKLMQHTVSSKQIKIIPERFEKTYFSWVDNLRDWCISRQIWYGHQIPAWYNDEKNEVYVGIEPPTGDGWQQDPDTLDTWFSSGLWTFSTLGWPEGTEDLQNYHPTSVLETGYDIIFFWVARMILMSGYTLGDIPFKHVYLHGLVRDEHGKKMSKSLGNVLDPLDMVTKFGADATRLALMIGTTPGNDTKLSEEKIASYRNFVNKLWNISRYIMINVETIQHIPKEPTPQTLSDTWILSELNQLIADVTQDVDEYKFSSAGEKLYEFTWNKLADWYVEIAKIEKDKDDILLYTLEQLLKLWHPFTPFVTEVIWEQYNTDEMLVLEKWPQTGLVDTKAISDMNKLQQTITTLRSLRSDGGIKANESTSILVNTKDKTFFEKHTAVIEALTRTKIEFVSEEPNDAHITTHQSDFTAYILVSAEQQEKLAQEMKNLEDYIARLEKKLDNKQFTDNAPEAIINAEKKRLAEAKEKLAKY